MDPLLLEREEEVGGIEAVLSRAGEDDGGILLIEGPAGIGKSHLLGRAAARWPPSPACGRSRPGPPRSSRSFAPLHRASAAVELGSALRRQGARKEARELLREGLELARQSNATALAERARDELAASGARLRRERLTGVEALTAREFQVAGLAADGRSNPEIAQALFVTRKTVEAHLRTVFRKLDVARRTEIASTLNRSAR